MQTEEPNETIATLECVTDVILESKSDIKNILGNSGLRDTNEIIEKIELLIIDIENHLTITKG
jgi:hypothetical protein